MVLSNQKSKNALIDEKWKVNLNIEQCKHNNTITYPFASEIAIVINLRLKVEMNTREHFSLLGIKHMDFKVKNSWFNGEWKLPTYELEELFGRLRFSKD